MDANNLSNIAGWMFLIFATVPGIIWLIVYLSGHYLHRITKKNSVARFNAWWVSEDSPFARYAAVVGSIFAIFIAIGAVVASFVFLGPIITLLLIVIALIIGNKC